ncbi:MAG: hypothetical protein IT359_17180 [Gemmatimonadaceae bacterium]|nr:hypothetical protein [Gemmatimonadaceae bacterium]
MKAPATIPIGGTGAVEFSLRELTPIKVLYKFWIQRPGEAWILFGPELTDDDVADRWVILPPVPKGTTFSYWLAVVGHPNAEWQVQLSVRESGTSLSATTWEETGTTGSGGEFSMPTTVEVVLV